MFSLERLASLSNSSKRLDHFIEHHIEDIISFFDYDYTILKSKRFEIEEYIIDFEEIIEQLDYSKFYNSYFILKLLEFYEKFRLSGGFEVAYSISKNNELGIGKRLEIAKKFLLEIRKKEDHLLLFDEVLESLQESYIKEEDDNRLVLATFANYITNISLSTYNVDPKILNIALKDIDIARERYTFLDDSFIDEILKIGFENKLSQDILILERLFRKKTIIAYSSNEKLIEIDTIYSNIIKKISASYTSIRSYCLKLYKSNTKKDQELIFQKLLHGVRIIDQEDLLYGYMASFGVKHFKKIDLILKYLLPIDSERVNVIDWGCGQALASMIFLERTQYSNLVIERVILNEPSELSIKRGALHLSRFIDENIIKTVNKDIDSLTGFDVATGNNADNIHFFSNILDIELFNIYNLQDLISKTFNGVNYFVVASPYITRHKRDRIELFVNFFEKKYASNFTSIFSKDQIGGKTTMVIRVFKVEL